MGMYTELLVKGELRRDAPEEVRSALRSLITGEYSEDQVWPSHRFSPTNASTSLQQAAAPTLLPAARCTTRSTGSFSSMRP